MTTEENAKFSKFSFTKKEIKELIKNNPEYIQYIEKVFKERKFKSIKDLTITDGYLFGTVMLNKEICKGVLEAILEIKITDIQFVELEKTAQNGYETKTVRFDVILKDDKGNVYNIEMQVSSKGRDFLGQRTRYYQIMIDSLMLKKGDDYSKLKKSIIIFICPFKLFDRKRQVYTFNTYCKEDKELQLNDEITKIFISTKNKKDKKLNIDLEAFINYVNGKVNKDNLLIKKIEDEIEEIKNREEWRVEYMLSVLNYSDARIEGRIEGRRQGRIEGRREGRIEGRMEGRREGRREGAIFGRKIGEIQKTVNDIKSLIEGLNFSTEQSMSLLSIPTEEQGLYYKLVNDPVFYEEYFADDNNFIDPSDYEDFDEDDEEDENDEDEE